jgi:hypothetical protein
MKTRKLFNIDGSVSFHYPDGQHAWRLYYKTFYWIEISQWVWIKTRTQVSSLTIPGTYRFLLTSRARNYIGVSLSDIDEYPSFVQRGLICHGKKFYRAGSWRSFFQFKNNFWRIDQKLRLLCLKVAPLPRRYYVVRSGQTNNPAQGVYAKIYFSHQNLTIFNRICLVSLWLVLSFSLNSKFETTILKIFQVKVIKSNR